MGVCHIQNLAMKYILTLLIAFLHLPLWAGQSKFYTRRLQIEEYTKQAASLNDFRQVADSLHLTIDELCDYPVIFPIRQTRRISSGFGMRWHPIKKRRQFHTGIDIPQRKGTPVYATGNGIVIATGYDSGYGYFVEIQHAGGFHSFYAHLSRILVNVGERVGITQQIACVGNTGASIGSHLHYEVRKGTHYLNPIGWCWYLFRVLETTNNFIFPHGKNHKY